MLADVLIKATVFEIFNAECLARVEDGNVITIDPFVTATFDLDDAEKLIGTWIFKGFWNEESQSFLANEVMHPLEVDYQSQIDTLQQQNKQLIEGMETAIMWFRGNEMHIKAEQLNKTLKTIQGGNT